jgi:hypothetical protein
MTIANVSTAYGTNTGSQKCYTESTDQFGKPAFSSLGQAVVVEFSSVPVTTGSAITINTNGTVNLAANITYRFDMHCETVPSVVTQPGFDAVNRLGLVLFNQTTGQLILPTFPMNTSGTVFYTTTQAEDVVMLAYMPDGTPPNTITQPQTWQYPQQITNASLGVQAISGEDI